MEDFVTWVDTSKLKRTVMKYNDEVCDSFLRNETRSDSALVGRFRSLVDVVQKYTIICVFNRCITRFVNAVSESCRNRVLLVVATQITSVLKVPTQTRIKMILSLKTQINFQKTLHLQKNA